MQITEQQLRRIMPLAGTRAVAYMGSINSTITYYGINTPQRASAFLAQIAHESGQMRFGRVLGSDAYLAK